MGYWLVDCRLGSADDATPALILLTNWCYTKMASRDIIIICILYLIVWSYCVQNIIKIGRWVFGCKPKQCHFWAWLKRPIFGVLDSQNSAETLVSRCGITNYQFNSILFQQYLCEKLPKSVDVHWSYSVQRHCRFFGDTVYLSLKNDQIRVLFLKLNSDLKCLLLIIFVEADTAYCRAERFWEIN